MLTRVIKCQVQMATTLLLKEIQFRLGNAGRPKSGSGTENMKRPKLVRGSVPNIKPMEFGFVINGVEVGLKRRTDGVEVLEQNKIKIDSLVSFFQAQPLSLPSLPSHSFHHCQSSLFSEFSRMETDQGKLNSELDEKIYQIYKDFLTRVTKFEELVAIGGRLLAGFQEGLEYLRRPPIDRTSKLVENIIKANETKRVKSYFEAGCINTHDGVHSISKSKSILSGLECLLEDVTRAMQNVNGTLSPICIEDFGDGLNEKATIDGKEVASSRIQRPEVTDFAALMGFIYSMLKQDYVMQEKIVSALNFKLSSGELESYCLMWSLRPFVNDEIMHQAWKLIP